MALRAPLQSDEEHQFLREEPFNDQAQALQI
jgi:hypothetical protein